MYPFNTFLHSKFNFENVPCYHANIMRQSFWRALQDWKVDKRVVSDSFTLTLQDVMYGITKEYSVLYDLINNIILLEQFFIHKCQYF